MMARDILAAPATTVGVERLFNQAHDICHYCRSRLSAESISASMMVKVFDRIELLDELEAIKESDPFIDLKFDHHEIEREEPVSYISDDEDTDYGSDSGFPSTQKTPPGSRLSRPTTYMNAIRIARAKCDDSGDAPGSDATNENNTMNDSKEDETANDTDLSNDSDPLHGNSPSQPRPKPRFLIHARGLPPSQLPLQPLSQPPS